jgi:holo-[acyl-carrier-protein] synthase
LQILLQTKKMKPRGIGLDILQVSRIEATYARFPKLFPNRILSKEEMKAFNYLEQKSSTSDQSTQIIAFLSKRFAIKEAAYKAVYPFIKLQWKMLSLSEKYAKPALVIEPCFHGIIRDQIERRRRVQNIMYPKSDFSALKHKKDLTEEIKNELGVFFHETKEEDGELIDVDPSRIQFQVSLSHDGDILAAVALATI